MLNYPNIDPVALQLGPLKIHWYGLSYLIGFYGAWWIALRRTRLAHVNWTKDEVSDLLFYAVMGIILGGRLGYTLFYNFSGWLADPLVLLRIWEGGMSFHGGLIGVVTAIILFARKTGRPIHEVGDFTVVVVPFGLMTGRIGNFINGELWGGPSDLPWAMVFPGAGPEARHPSMLYEAFLEGAVLLAILLWFSSKPRPALAVSGVFLFGYGLFRSLVETVRVPDEHIGYLAWDWLTMGQLLSLPMMLAGAAMLAWGYFGGGVLSRK